MIIKCFRHLANFGVELELERADNTNADYVIAEDTKADELRTVIMALYNNSVTIAKATKSEPISDSEYDAVEIATLAEAVNAVKVKSEVRLKTIQKTGLICPNCYKPTDKLIWGIHKEIL